MIRVIRRRSIVWSVAISLLLLLAGCVAGTGPEPGNAGIPVAGEPAPEEPAPAGETETAATDLAAEASSIEVEPSDVTSATETAVDGENPFAVGDDRPDRLRFITSGWQTDWEIHAIDYAEILSGGPPRDGIPPIDEPTFVTQDEAAEWLAENEPVIALELNGDARAYPLQILTWHEIVNDEVGDVPVTVTFCPLCNSAIVFDRRLDGVIYDFGTSGLLRNSDLVMWDRQTESLWQQFTGDAIVGKLTGKRLTFLPSSLIGFGDFRTAYPEGLVLSRDTGHGRPYGQNPYAGYDTIGSSPFLFTGIIDGRLPAMARVVTVSLENEGIDVAYPLDTLLASGVINDRQGAQDLVVFHKAGTTSALGARVIAEAEDVGATGIFDPNLSGQKLTFSRDENGQIRDEQTGSAWNIVGQAIDGPLAGEHLTPVVHADHFWFSWAAFRPDTVIYSAP